MPPGVRACWTQRLRVPGSAWRSPLPARLVAQRHDDTPAPRRDGPARHRQRSARVVVSAGRAGGSAALGQRHPSCLTLGGRSGQRRPDGHGLASSVRQRHETGLAREREKREAAARDRSGAGSCARGRLRRRGQRGDSGAVGFSEWRLGPQHTRRPCVVCAYMQGDAGAADMHRVVQPRPRHRRTTLAAAHAALSPQPQPAALACRPSRLPGRAVWTTRGDAACRAARRPCPRRATRRLTGGSLGGATRRVVRRGGALG